MTNTSICVYEHPIPDWVSLLFRVEHLNSSTPTMAHYVFVELGSFVRRGIVLMEYSLGLLNPVNATVYRDILDSCGLPTLP